jgi:alkyl sulfatase BDS1-like metallo-beta-lactamase superfamily hydrolase
LTTIATTLEDLVAQVLAAMNSGASLDEVVNGCRVPDSVLALPYMRPFYDEPEFVVNNLWRLYGGWWDGNAATLKPPRADAIAVEVADLAGGTEVLVARARALAEHGDLRMACQVIEWAGRAEPESVSVHGARAEIYESRRRAERSLMATGIFGAAAAASQLVADEAGGS